MINTMVAIMSESAAATVGACMRTFWSKTLFQGLKCRIPVVFIGAEMNHQYYFGGFLIIIPV